MVHSRLDLISGKLCFDTAFSKCWLQSMSHESSVMLIAACEAERDDMEIRWLNMNRKHRPCMRGL